MRIAPYFGERYTMGDIVPFTNAAEAELSTVIAEAEQEFPSLSFSGLRTHYDRFCETCNRPLIRGEACTPNCTPRTLDTQTAVAEGTLMLHLT